VIAVIVFAILFCLRRKKESSTNNMVVSDPIGDTKKDLPSGSVSGSPPPVYPNSPANPQTHFYTPMKDAQTGQSPMTDAFGRPLFMYPAGSPTNTVLYPPHVSGISPVASPPPSDIDNTVAPVYQHASAPQYGVTELPGEHVVSTGGQGP
jgi:hypothetical protein